MTGIIGSTSSTSSTSSASASTADYGALDTAVMDITVAGVAVHKNMNAAVVFAHQLVCGEQP